MADIKVLYRGREAGLLSGDLTAGSSGQYDFMPYRSKAHLDLSHALASPPVEIELDLNGRRLSARAHAMSPRSITLTVSGKTPAS